MKKLFTILALLFVGLSTYATDICKWEGERRGMRQDVPPFMGSSNGGENNKSMFRWMRKSRLRIKQSDDTLILQSHYEDPRPLGRVFLAIDGISVGELVSPNKEISIRSIELYYNGQKNKRTIDLHDYVNSSGYIEVGFVGVEVPVFKLTVIRYD